MSCFDGLPEPVREAVRTAVYDLHDPVELRSAVGVVKTPVVANSVKQLDALWLEQRRRVK